MASFLPWTLRRSAFFSRSVSYTHLDVYKRQGLQHLLDSFVEIGLGYLSLERPSGTLSGGESQRTKMIRHLGSSLTDITYVFDEPSIGLHPHDIQRMNELLLRLRDKGNTVLVVEHKMCIRDRP